MRKINKGVSLDGSFNKVRRMSHPSKGEGRLSSVKHKSFPARKAVKRGETVIIYCTLYTYKSKF